jgi:dTDP-4-dehydrorhamnose reductase
MKKILIIGRNGQVGWELHRSLQLQGEIIAAGHALLDLSAPDTLRAPLRDLHPDIIVNAAAYTAVDQAEKEESLATRINGESVAILAEEAARSGALLVHYSTDYVFDGSKPEPYTEQDPTKPINAYGRSKLAGEQALQDSKANWICLRTSWVYAARGRNFLRTMLRLAAEREHLRIVSDQVGAPTSARLIADATAHILARVGQQRQEGQTFTPKVYHLTARGATSWHGFASRILERARDLKALPEIKVKGITAIGSTEYPTPAARPKNSRLSCTAIEQDFGLTLPDWEASLELVLAELASSANS